MIGIPSACLGRCLDLTPFKYCCFAVIVMQSVQSDMYHWVNKNQSNWWRQVWWCKATWHLVPRCLMTWKCAPWSRFSCWLSWQHSERFCGDVGLGIGNSIDIWEVLMSIIAQCFWDTQKLKKCNRVLLLRLVRACNAQQSLNDIIFVALCVKKNYFHDYIRVHLKNSRSCDIYSKHLLHLCCEVLDSTRRVRMDKDKDLPLSCQHGWRCQLMAKHCLSTNPTNLFNNCWIWKVFEKGNFQNAPRLSINWLSLWAPFPWVSYWVEGKSLLIYLILWGTTTNQTLSSLK